MARARHGEQGASPVIAGYDVGEQIGAGGFSTVWAARQIDLERLVAVKVLAAPFTDERQRADFRAECKVLGRLSGHPHVVTVHGAAFTDDDRPCIVMELYDGTYRDVGRLTVPQVVDVGLKVAEALDHVHRKHVVHRDIKPHNLFVSEHGEPALSDFGISSVHGVQSHGNRMTLKYSAPEQLRDQTTDEKTDIYSLGVTLFQLTTGRVPFDADSEEMLVQAIMSDEAPGLDRSDAPPELAKLLRRCLAKDPRSRPRSAGEIADEFRHIQSLVGSPRRRPRAEHDDRSRLFEVPSVPNVGQDLTTTDDRGRRSAGTRSSSTADSAGRPTDRAGEDSDADGRRTIVLGVAAVFALIALGAVVLAFAGGGDETTSTTVAPSTTAVGSDFVVLSPPETLTVETVDGGFSFRWTGVGADEKVQLRRLGTDDSTIADISPFVWSISSADVGDCFEARTVDADETRLSQSAVGPVCASD